MTYKSYTTNITFYPEFRTEIKNHAVYLLCCGKFDKSYRFIPKNTKGIKIEKNRYF